MDQAYLWILQLYYCITGIKLALFRQFLYDCDIMRISLVFLILIYTQEQVNLWIQFQLRQNLEYFVFIFSSVKLGSCLNFFLDLGYLSLLKLRLFSQFVSLIKLGLDLDYFLNFHQLLEILFKLRLFHNFIDLIEPCLNLDLFLKLCQLFNALFELRLFHIFPSSIEPSLDLVIVFQYGCDFSFGMIDSLID